LAASQVDHPRVVSLRAQGSDGDGHRGGNEDEGTGDGKEAGTPQSHQSHVIVLPHHVNGDPLTVHS